MIVLILFERRNAVHDCFVESFQSMTLLLRRWSICIYIISSEYEFVVKG